MWRRHMPVRHSPGMTRLTACALALLLAPVASGLPRAPGMGIAERFGQLTPASTWTLVDTIPLDFDAFHPQGMVRVGADFVVSSVEVRRAPARYPSPVEGFDRDTGEGAGHLFRISSRGQRLRDVIVGEGTLYHPSGLDYDGQAIWMAGAEYRPGSRSVIYRVDAATLETRELFRYADHIGAVAFDTDRRMLLGMSWGSRQFVRWPDPLAGPSDLPATRQRNPSFHLDYQDCKALGAGQVLCGGLRTRRLPTGESFSVGGLELISLDDGRPLHQLPIDLHSSSGRSLTQNAFWIAPQDEGLRIWFLPDDGRAAIVVYDVRP